MGPNIQNYWGGCLAPFNPCDVHPWLTRTEERLQRITNAMNDVATDYGMKITLKRQEVMKISTHADQKNELIITLDGKM